MSEHHPAQRGNPTERPAEPLSERNPRVVSAVKLHRSAARRKSGFFLAEGANSVTAALDTGRIEELFYSADGAVRFEELIAAVTRSGVPATLVSDRTARALGDTVAPPGLVAVCDLVDMPLADLLTSASLRSASAESADRPQRSGNGVLDSTGRTGRKGDIPLLFAVPVGIADPGNAGTVIRVADAVGADGIVLAGDCVDPHNGKCVRSAAGSVFHLPLARERSVDAVLDACEQAGISTVATAADGDVDLDDADELLAGPVAWLFGNEAHGLDPAVASRARYRLRIPMRGRAESLNLATAAAICLYASSRVRYRAE